VSEAECSRNSDLVVAERRIADAESSRKAPLQLPAKRNPAQARLAPVGDEFEFAKRIEPSGGGLHHCFDTERRVFLGNRKSGPYIRAELES